MKGLIDLGIGGVIGLFVGIAFAQWVGPAATSAYLLLVAISIILFSALARIVTSLTR